MHSCGNIGRIVSHLACNHIRARNPQVGRGIRERTMDLQGGGHKGRTGTDKVALICRLTVALVRGVE